MFKNKKHKVKLAALSFLFIFLISGGLGCQGGSNQAVTANAPVTLKYWRVWDSENDFQSIVNAYKALHPNVSIDYRRFRYDEYEQQILAALAEDRGPDILSINNTWVGKYKSKLVPMPTNLSLPYEVHKEYLGGLKKETIIEMRPSKMITPTQLKEKFVDVVYNDVVVSDPDAKSKQAIYALPLSVDTMVLFYNKDLLNSAGIPEPPKTWLEFQDDVKKIVKQDNKGKIIYAGAALGTANNVARSFDILSLLMMQNGVTMADGSAVAFNRMPAGMKDRETLPSTEALIFYTDFANPAKEVYTWNDEMPNSLDAFINGKVAFFLGYAYSLKDITARSPKLNFGYAPIPQIEGNTQVNYANYWVEAVSKKSKKIDWAWDFLQFATTQEKNVKSYLDKTQNPTALRSLIPYQVEKEKLLPFVSQVLTAKSWYHGRDSAVAEKAFKDMVNSVAKGEIAAQEAIGLAASRIAQTL